MSHGSCLEHVNRVGTDAAPDWPRGTPDDVYRVEIEGTPSITQETAFRFTDGSGRDAIAAGCLATGLRALNAVPAVNELPPGWATALDLPLIPRRGPSAELPDRRARPAALARPLPGLPRGPLPGPRCRHHHRNGGVPAC